MIFLGTVTESHPTLRDKFPEVRMRIDHAYKGVEESSVTLFDDGMCDGPQLEVGEQYLMYTHRLPSGAIPSRGCSRSRHVKFAEEDFKFLNSVADARPVSSIFGRVLSRTDGYRGTDQPLAGAQIEISAAGTTRTTMTDGDGRYAFENLPPEKYVVTAAFNGFRQLFGMENRSVNAEPRGCATANLVMRRMWQGGIAGRVFRSTGEPAPAGLNLSLMRLESQDGKAWLNLLGSGAQTNDQGEYSFDEVAPGRYKVVVNQHRFPTENVPYPTIYWPGTRSEADAIPIEVVDAANAQRCDFRLPVEPKSAVVTGLVIGPDGKPAMGVEVFVAALPDNYIATSNENRPQTDGEGRFSFTALEGWEYKLSAYQYGTRSLHSEDLHFTLKDGPSSPTLVCDRPGRF